MADILPYLGVQRQAEGEPFLLEDLAGKTVKEVKTLLKDQKITVTAARRIETGA